MTDAASDEPNDNHIPELPGETLQIWSAFSGASLTTRPAWLINDECATATEEGHAGVGYIEAKVMMSDGDQAEIAVEVLDDDTYTIHVSSGLEVALHLLNELVELSGATTG